MTVSDTRKSHHLEEQDITVSFEFFPPKTEKMAERLWQAFHRLAPLGPEFVSVTYGAGGSTRSRTHEVVARIAAETPITPAAHLTCVGASRSEVDQVIRDYAAAGVRHIVALRGDPPEGVGHRFTPHPEGYASSVELVRAIKRLGDFHVFVSAYPEKHPESPSVSAELDWLKAKVEAGAEAAITQFFFDNAVFLRYLERVRAHGIEIPIIPGIIPIHNFRQVAGFARQAGASVPTWLAHHFEGLEDDPQTQHYVAAAVAAEQVMELVDSGIDTFHFYTLNRADLVYAICHMLGLRPTVSVIQGENER